MTRFIQLHLLTSYPPANLNRDDTGQPKTAMLGGVQRLRVSSQSLKRAWRTSKIFEHHVGGKENVGTRTRKLSMDAAQRWLEAGVKEADAKAWAELIAKLTGLQSKKTKESSSEPKSATAKKETLLYLSPSELTRVRALIDKLVEEKRAPKAEEFDFIGEKNLSADIAMFGRMLASKSEFTGEAAVQVAHAIGVHASPIEDDYFTAVDDLNDGELGAGHIGESGFAAAVFYQYICIDRELLLENLKGDEALVARALRALTEAALKVGPSGKQNSYASRAYAHFALAEKGSQQPRSLTLAYLRPVTGDSYGATAAEQLQDLVRNMEKVYGPCSDSSLRFDVLKGEGSSQALLDFVAEA